MLTRYIFAFVFVLILGADAFANRALAGSIEEQRAILVQNGYQRWEWMRSDCEDCEIYFLTAAPEMQTEKVQAFFHALSDKKPELQRIYQVSGPEYTLLATISIGILGRESKFWTSPRYILKESVPWLVHLVKLMRAYLSGSSQVMPLSRGPTQIKYIPKKIVEFYGVTPDTLHAPENAAVATMGFLIETLGELKRRIVINQLDYINESNYVDYLPYLYFGSRRKLITRQATPETNIYVREMKGYMSQVEVYERRPEEGVISLH